MIQKDSPKDLESGFAEFLAIMELPHGSVSIGKWYLEAAA